MRDAVEHARAEQLRCAELYPDPGAWLGCHDWFAEEFLMEQERNNDTAAQVARLREMAEGAKARAQSFLRDGQAARDCGNERLYRADKSCAESCERDAVILSAAADALEREAWCEEVGADVVYEDTAGLWRVMWMSEDREHAEQSAPTRKAAIDAARRGGK